MAARSERPLWQCPDCERRFANRNQSHFCGRYDLQTHFERKPPEIRMLFDAVVSVIQRCGPVSVLPEKTRIAFQTRMSFAQVTPRMKWLDGHVVLAQAGASAVPENRYDLAQKPRPPLSSQLAFRPGCRV